MVSCMHTHTAAISSPDVKTVSESERDRVREREKERERETACAHKIKCSDILLHF